MAPLWVLLVTVCWLTTGQTLPPLQFSPLSYGSVYPSGWLLRELELQSAGLSTAMPLFYDPINNTQWLGGTSTKDMWIDSFSYFLQGYLPQAILLNETAQLAQAARYIDYIIAHQGADGWIGPSTPSGTPAGRLYWPRYPVLMAFFALYEYQIKTTGTGDARLINTSLAWLHRSRELMRTIPYGRSGIGDSRWEDLLQPQAWLLDNVPSLPPAERAFLLELSQEVYRQGTAVVDWERQWYVDGWFPTTAVPSNRCNNTNHGVNSAMSVKSGAFVHRFGFNLAGNTSSYTRIALLDKYHGVPTGVFQADEHLAGRMPSHGSETCLVVEMTWSLNQIFTIQGDPAFAERSELITYNALPGSMTKDLNARVYLQQINEIAAVAQGPAHVWISDGDDSLLYSLDANFGETAACAFPPALYHHCIMFPLAHSEPRPNTFDHDTSSPALLQTAAP